MKKIKTNAMRILDSKKISYKEYMYESDPDHIDGVSVAAKLNQNPKQVFKTLVTVSPKKEYFVFVVPVEKELDLKKCAKSVNAKSVEMIHVKDINKITGYIRGGCSPIGMKKQFTTVFEETCLNFDTIIFSGGKIGFQIEVNPNDVIKMLNAKVADIAK